ncbi:hypothetical protein [Rhodococcus opacus]|uniref:hypothetical protein n=1 Tax=Rhodococcus opacus TaxID=37919 RepID=UPI0002FA8438|nr:hypothetical protein [Rhodococcus opacus]AHK35274.1 Integrase/recombinase xerD [Rhodococcus opacus PD630]UDH01601.1 hypothetical protein K2Z90_008167 [Rhodococcus opacus PD630]
MTTTGTNRHPAPDISALFAEPGPGSAYRYDWALFADWCAALDTAPLPADPVALARFLDAHPARRTTQRRRVAAINWVHTAGGHRPPGSSRAIREILSTRARRRDQRAELARDVVSALPTTGWPGGLFGRRDALLLVLSCTVDLTPTAVGRLQRSDLTYDGNTLLIGAGHDRHLHPAPEDPRGCPVAVYLRWARLQAFFDRYPSNRALARSLTEARPVTDDSVVSYRTLPALREDRDGPLLPSFDQWGHLAAPRRDSRGLSGKSVAAIVTAHLARTAASRRARSMLLDTPGSIVEKIGAEPHAAKPDSMGDDDYVELTAEELAARYAAGIAHKQTDAQNLRDLTDTFDDIDRKTDEILRRTEELLAQMGDPATD